MSKEAYYFSHDSNARNDEKILSLRMELGMEGYGIYWAIIEMLRDSKNYLMQTHYERIAFELHTDSDKVKSVIHDYDLFENDGLAFWSNSLCRRMEMKEGKSEKARKSALKRWGNAKGMRTHSDGNAIKGKEKKGKEKKDTPTIDEFIVYAKSLEIYKVNLDYAIKAKYQTWIDDGWRDGYGNKIKNWKNKLRSTLPHMKSININSGLNIPL